MLEIGVQENVVKATLYECIGQAFAIVGMAIAKASLGAFLLRLVVVPWHRFAIWFAMTLVACASIGESSRVQRPRRSEVVCWMVVLMRSRSPGLMFLAVVQAGRIRVRPVHPGGQMLGH